VVDEPANPRYTAGMAPTHKTCPICQSSNELLAENCVQCRHDFYPEKHRSEREDRHSWNIFGFVMLVAVIIAVIYFYTTSVHPRY